MLNKVYRLVRPRQFEIVYKDISLRDDQVIVHPTYLSICHADQRYYQGLRPETIMQKKLPMALIHEAIGRVIYDPTDTFAVGSSVVLIPNTPTEQDEIIAENYLRSSLFRASGFDGFLQEFVGMTPDRIVALPEGINPHIAAFTELVSVSYHAISRFIRFSHERRDRIGIWGDGNLGYITALLLRHRMPDSQIYVFGVNEYKLRDFTFATETHLVSDIPEGLGIDHAFECVGGGASSKAINQIIDVIAPEGTISILGVSEDLASVDTRMVLEKGLRIFGSSRSGRDDFEGLLKLYASSPNLVNHLEKIVGALVPIHHTANIVEAFEMDISKIIGKTILMWGE